MSENFHQITPTLDNKWRSIILFGRNVASYKFALATSLLELATKDQTLISLEDLALPFSRSICEHLKHTDKQATSTSSQFLDACRAFNREEIEQESLTSTTTKLGFNNVIDAFHIVNGAEISSRFFIDERKTQKSIRLTDDIFRLKELVQAVNLDVEVQSRWNLVETAWSLGLSRHLIIPDEDQEFLYSDSNRRKAVTSSRGALNGYQKGKCFYCFREILIGGDEELTPDVDHFFPWTLEKQGQTLGLNGVWNLVLACQTCNRGESGKHAKVPSLRLVERLNVRNNYLIDSHHPLRETLLIQTGKSESDRRRFLQDHYELAINLLHHTWQPHAYTDASF